MTTPNRFFMCGRNLSDEATITATVSAVSTLPLSNLQRTSHARVWRNSNSASVDIILSFLGTTSERLNFLHLNRHNLEPAALWRVRTYATYDATGATFYDSGAVLAVDGATLSTLDWGVDPPGGSIFNGFPISSTMWFMERSDVVNSVRVTIDDTGNSDGYTQASRIYTGRGFEFSRNMRSLDPQWEENTKQGRTDGGTITADGKPGFRKMMASFQNLNLTERAELMDIQRYAGMRRDLFASAFPDAGGEIARDHEAIWRVGSMFKISPMPGIASNDSWAASIPFVEA